MPEIFQEQFEEMDKDELPGVAFKLKLLGLAISTDAAPDWLILTVRVIPQPLIVRVAFRGWVVVFSE